MFTFKTIYIIIGAFILDCLIGDPQNPVHPMRLIGSGISLGMAVYRKAKIKGHVIQFIAGMALALAIVGLSYIITVILTQGFYRLNYWLGITMETVICYFLIAPKALKDESMNVYRSLTAGNIDDARKNLSFIVGRDTQNLGVQAIVKAAVETVAENLSDGVIAPLIFIYIGGAPLGMAYKAVNTLDSMIGYRNDGFEYFGKFAARLDDIANFIPSRLSALLTILGSVFIGADVKGAIRIYIRDRYNHKSPNSAQTESVCAGALGLCLGGDNYYHGTFIHKPAIGDGIHEPAPEHIISANRLMYAATICSLALLTVIAAIFTIIRGSGYV